MQGFFINTRKEIFKDPIVRQALNYAFDFEWTNKILFFSQYQRTDSYFSNSELAASNLSTNEKLTLLEPFRNELPKEIFNEVFKNQGVVIEDLGDGILNCEFRSKMNTIGGDVLSGLNKAVDLAERNFEGLVIGLGNLHAKRP